MIDNYKRNYIAFILKFIFSIFLGLSITIIFMQNDSWVKKYIGDSLKSSLEDSLHCKVNCKIDSINIFSPTITFKEISMEATDGTWLWECFPLSISCSWLDILFYGIIEFYIDLHDLKVTSELKANGLAIWPHIHQWITDVTWSFPTVLRSFAIKKGSVCIKESSLDSTTHLFISSITKNIDGTYRSKVSFRDGNCFIKDKKCIDNISGPITFDISNNSGNMCLYLDSNCIFESPLIPGNQTCFFYGKWKYDQGIFCVKNQDSSFVVEPIKMYFLGNTLFLSVDMASDLKTVAQLLFNDFSFGNDISGSCSMRFKSEFGPFSHGSSGFLALKNVGYKGFDCFSLIRLSFKKNKNKIWSGLLSLSRPNGLLITGDCKLDEENMAIECKVSNKNDIKIPIGTYWKISPNASSISLRYNYNSIKKLNGTYNFCANNDKLHTKLDITGNIGCNNNGVYRLAGTINKNNYGIDLSVDKKLRIKKCTYNDESGNPIFNLNALDNDYDKLRGYIKFPLIKSFISNYCQYNINGNGDVKIYSMIKDDALFCQLYFTDGSISLPGLYNFINGFKMTCKLDPFNKSIFIKDIFADLHKGTISGCKGVVNLNDTYGLNFAYFPLFFDNCLINWADDLFALASGRFLFYKNKNCAPTLKGLVFIERSQLKRNIFSFEVQKQVSSSTSNAFESLLQDMLCDISVRTKDPVRVKTPFLETSANLDLTIRRSILNPEVSGKIDFISGSMSFPYKPLYITKGSLYFLPHRPKDPIIELTAKNKINKYNITLYVSGSALKHTISLDSSPPLSEEQIISLLIAGSAQESLNIVMPALIMQNLKGVIFGSQESRFDGKDYLQRLFKPFKNVYIVPSFTDQTGRGGLRGSVEIDISERWRALIQKNFSLSEDTRFEIECLLTDDVSFRGFRDESGDIGTEIEMKWDF